MFKRGAGLHVPAATTALSAGVFAVPVAGACSTIIAAAVNDGDMVATRKPPSVFQRKHADIHVGPGADGDRAAPARRHWHRHHAGRFDVMTIGNDEVPMGLPAQNVDAKPDRKAVAPLAGFMLQATSSANPNGRTGQPRPHVGARFVAIPKLQGIATQVGQTLADVSTGRSTVDQAPAPARPVTARPVRHAGHPPN